jgi:hypothetical protein
VIKSRHQPGVPDVPAKPYCETGIIPAVGDVNDGGVEDTVVRRCQTEDVTNDRRSASHRCSLLLQNVPLGNQLEGTRRNLYGDLESWTSRDDIAQESRRYVTRRKSHRRYTIGGGRCRTRRL